MKKLTEVAFFTDKVGEMRDFYAKLLSAAPVAESEGMAIFMVGETKLFIHHTYTPGKEELSPENHLAFSVEDVDSACASLQAVGMSLEVAPADYYWGRSAYLRDPDGHLIEITKSA